jgi:hypothetical protein
MPFFDDRSDDRSAGMYRTRRNWKRFVTRSNPLATISSHTEGMGTLGPLSSMKPAEGQAPGGTPTA